MPCTKIRGGRVASPRDVQLMWKSNSSVEWLKVWVSSMVDEDGGLFRLLDMMLVWRQRR